jgi:hypothetical protein
MKGRRGAAHAKFYTKPSKQKEQGPWRATFVDDVSAAFPAWINCRVKRRMG